MDQPPNDWRVWQWALTVASSVLSGAVVGGWVARGVLESLRQRVSTLERDQTKCQATLKIDIQAIVQGEINKRAVIDQTHFESIRTDLAVLVALHSETQKDVQSIFWRMNQRSTDTNDHHEERRKANQ